MTFNVNTTQNFLYNLFQVTDEIVSIYFDKLVGHRVPTLEYPLPSNVAMSYFAWRNVNKNVNMKYTSLINVELHAKMV